MPMCATWHGIDLEQDAVRAEVVRAQAEIELLALCEGENNQSSSAKKRRKQKRRKAKGAPSEAYPADTPAEAFAFMANEVTEGEESCNADCAILEAIDLAQRGLCHLTQLDTCLETHAANADESLVKEARVVRRNLKDKQRKLRRQVDKAVFALVSAIEVGTDVTAIKIAIEAAEQVMGCAADCNSGLQNLVERAKDRLEKARIEQQAAQKVASIESLEDEFVALALSQPKGILVPDDGVLIDEDKLCVVCLANAKEAVFAPCGIIKHLCACCL